MSRASVITARLRGRGRREKNRVLDYRTPPGGISRYSGNLLAGDSTEAGGPPGSLTPEARRQLKDSLRTGIERAAAARAGGDDLSIIDDLAGVPAGAWPYEDIPAAQMAAYRAAAASEFPAPKPEFHPAHAAARETRALPMLREQPPAGAPVPGGSALYQVYASLKGLDMAALDEAQQKGLTYAQAHAARGRTPLGDKVARNFRPEVRPERRHGEAVAARIAKLDYPPCDVTAPVSAVADNYDALMRHLDAITGTTGIRPGLRPRPELTAGRAS